MSTLRTLLATMLLLAPVAAQSPWQKLYEGDEATGAQVIALYQFRPGQELVDNSGHGHHLTLRGTAKVIPAGPLPGAGALETTPADPKNDQASGAMTPTKPRLSPAGAFTIELWFQPRAEFAKTANWMLVDKKYIHYDRAQPGANDDYCLFLRRAGDAHQLVAALGYGTSSSYFNSRPVNLTAGQWVHLAFTYNGAGVGRFYVNGQPAGRQQVADRGPVAPGKHPLVIGDRVGSTFMATPGLIGQVRLLNGLPAAFEGGVDLSAERGRRVFERFEPRAKLTVVLANDLPAPVRDVQMSLTMGGATRVVGQQATVAPSGQVTAEVPVDTAVRPGDYPVQVAATMVGPRGPLHTRCEVPLAIVARLPERMPVVMWGNDSLIRDAEQIGFTHQITAHADPARVWRDGEKATSSTPDDVAAQRVVLDEHLRRGLRGVGYIHEPGYIERTPELMAKYGRIGRDGKIYERAAVCASSREVVAFSRNTGRALAADYGDHPAFDGCLVHSEMRDHSELCYHDYDRAACRRATGRDYPELATSKYGVRYNTIKGFPADRVVPDDYPLLAFYRWFWKEGDGWNQLHTAAHEGLRQHTRPGFWTWFDPVVRVPSVWGSGGQVDVLSTWTYSYPDPLKMGQSTDEVLAMAAGTRQRAMKMTQIIWYRTGTAPKLPPNEADRADWEREQPDAQFITISPDHLREALWCMISRPVEGIMYHGWQSLVPQKVHSAYRCTNLKTREALTQLTRDVIRPYGPMLRHVPDGPHNVALLESFASQVFAGRGSYGWGTSWEADAHLIAQWAQLQPKIVYDEQVVRDGLDAYQVLILPGCDVLTRSVVDRIRAFQNRGGLVVADGNLCPAIVPDILLPTYPRQRKADVDKAALQKLAAGLRSELDPVYQREYETDNPDVVCRRRRAGQADYLFVINDRRQFGKYVGHHGLVMEDGVPATATVRCRRPGAVVYDALARQQVATQSVPGGLSWPVALGPGAGRLYVLLDTPVTDVVVTAPAGTLGQTLTVAAQVNAGRAAVNAVVPLQVDLRDPQGRPAEFSGYHAAPGGAWRQTLALAANDLPGRWTIKVTELLGGKAAEASFEVRR